MSKISFPKNFLWGAASAAHQIEGNNFNSDWYEWERSGHIKDGSSSSPGCNSENNLSRDLELVKNLNLKGYRFSIEWSKIQPEENVFDEKHIKRYVEFIDNLKKNGIEPIVTLHHFVNPLWFSKKGGFEKEENIKCFSLFVDKIVSIFGEKVRFYTVLNEPMVYVMMSYVNGDWPPGGKDFKLGMKVAKNLLIAYDESYRIIKKINKNSMVSIAKHTASYKPLNVLNPLDLIVTKITQQYFDHAFIDSILERKLKKPFGTNENCQFNSDFDFIGINYYTKRYMTLKKMMPTDIVKNEGLKTDIGWHYYPEGLYEVLIRFGKKYNKPIMITENGIADTKDTMRSDYIKTALVSINKAINEGVNVIGYMHWSLMDNFEWIEGTSQRFGLYETDYENQKFILRNSGNYYKKIVSENQLDI